ncbi:MAG TPA: hypothetical protein VGL58_18345 [Caulobacteraceae bacterium]|jgi:hypothetical protein
MTAGHTDKSETNARQGMTTGHVRWVLRFSTVLAVVAMVGAWAWYSTHEHVTYGRNGEAVNAQAR